MSRASNLYVKIIFLRRDYRSRKVKERGILKLRPGVKPIGF